MENYKNPIQARWLMTQIFRNVGLGKEPWSAEVLAKSKKYTELVVEGSSYKYQLQPHNKLQK